MTKLKTHFPQVPVEIAKKVAKAEAKGNAIEPLTRLKKNSHGHALAAKPEADEVV